VDVINKLALEGLVSGITGASSEFKDAKDDAAITLELTGGALGDKTMKLTGGSSGG